MLIGYARASIDDQDLELQKNALYKASCQRIFEETPGGGIIQREELNKALDVLREGDTLVIWRLDRLGYSFKHLIKTLHSLKDKGVGFKSLTESIDTTASTSKLIFHIFDALAVFENNLIKERTTEELAVGRARGRKGGRPALTPEKIAMAISLYNEKTHPINSICSILHITKPTLYKYLKISHTQGA